MFVIDTNLIYEPIGLWIKNNMNFCMDQKHFSSNLGVKLNSTNIKYSQRKIKRDEYLRV